jgi:hypothetical protein
MSDRRLRWGRALLTIVLLLRPWLLLIVPSFLATGEFDATRAFPLSQYLTEIIAVVDIRSTSRLCGVV